MATYQLPLAEVMICMGDIAKNWKVLKEMYEDYATATLTSKDDAIQVATQKSPLQKKHTLARKEEWKTTREANKDITKNTPNVNIVRGKYEATRTNCPAFGKSCC